MKRLRRGMVHESYQNTLADAEAGTVAFDEFEHGFQDQWAFGVDSVVHALGLEECYLDARVLINEVAHGRLTTQDSINMVIKPCM